MPVFWLGIICRYYLAEGGVATIFPDGEYVGLHAEPVPVVLRTCSCRGSCSPCSSSASTAACCAATSSTRSTRTTSAPRRRRACRRGGSCVKHVLRTSLIPIITLFGLDFAVGARRRRDPDRDRVRPARRRPVRGAVDQQLRPAADHGRDDVRRVLHHRSSASSSISSTRTSTRGSGRRNGRAPARGQRPLACTSRPRTASCTPSTASRSSSSAARCSGSSASPARARA